MNAHQLDADGVIINTIVVESLGAFPNLVAASVGGQIGDRIVSGVVVPKPTAPNAPILSTIAAIEATVTPRRIREALTTAPGKDWMISLDEQIAALRGSLVK